MTKKFTRKIENFVCGQCGQRVEGDGYTDHCPNCLWGKHVDIHPGDRMSDCGGAMEPIGIEEKKREQRIKYRCQKCDHEFTVKSSKSDNIDKIIAISAGPQ